MSQETLAWLNEQTLIGFTEKRGKAWHYRASEQGAKSNHFEGPVPVQEVLDRLFHWEVVEGDVSSTASILTPDGVETFTVKDANRKSMLRPPRTFGEKDAGAILGLFKDGYKGHSYKEWLLEKVAEILDDELGIGAAGLLKGGAQAFVTVEVPENIVTPEGVEFRPHLLATTSFDGSLSTTFKRIVTEVVCDNTHAAGLAEKGQQLKVRHSRYSDVKLLEARDALALVHTIGDDFAQQVAELTSIKVSDADLERFLDVTAPLKDENGQPKVKRGLTLATKKRDEIKGLLDNDIRVAPWAGTAWGVVQAVNTHAHHVQGTRGTARAERNANLTVDGTFEKLDFDTFDTLKAVLA